MHGPTYVWTCLNGDLGVTTTATAEGSACSCVHVYVYVYTVETWQVWWCALICL